MAVPQWDEEMKFELFRLKSELRLDNFRVLAMPLGLGAITREPSSREAPLFPAAAVPPVPASAYQASVLVAPPTIPTKPMPPPTPIQMRLEPVTSHQEGEDAVDEYGEGFETFHRSLWARINRFVLVHMLDLLFVGMCVLLGFGMLGWIIDPAHMSFRWEVLSQAAPLALVQKLRVWALILGLYLVFTLYWLFFKFVSGQTLGETCVDNFREGEEPLQAHEAQDSAKT